MTQFIGIDKGFLSIGSICIAHKDRQLLYSQRKAPKLHILNFIIFKAISGE